jgi:hypothetical protein
MPPRSLRHGRTGGLLLAAAALAACGAPPPAPAERASAEPAAPRAEAPRPTASGRAVCPGGGDDLLTFAGRCDVAGVERCLDAGVTADATTDEGAGVYDRAVAGRCEEVVRVLVARGELVAQDDRNNPLGRAVLLGEAGIAAALLAGHASPDVTLSGRPPVVIAVERGDAPMLRLLLDYGASADAPDERGRTALGVAAERWNGEAARELVARGADPLAESAGVTPFEIARRHGDQALLDLFAPAAGSPNGEGPGPDVQIETPAGRAIHELGEGDSGPAARIAPRLSPLEALLWLAVAGLPAAAGEETPHGYSWVDCTGMGARLLLPDGWHFRDRPGSESDVCSISTAPPDGTGQFETGLAITRLRNVPDKAGVSTSDFARRLLDEVAKTHRVRRRSSSSQPPFEAYRAEVETEAPDGGTLRLYELAIANPSTGTVYLVVFRTPAKRWDADWKRVEPVVERLGLDTGG